MKTFLTIIGALLITTVFIVPTDEAPLSAVFSWFLWGVGAVSIFAFVCKTVEQWDEEDERNKKN